VNDTFWFRHELVKSCVEQGLNASERKQYHSALAAFFQDKFDFCIDSGEAVEYVIGLGCAPHHHLAGNHKQSVRHNLSFGKFCFSTGALDTAEKCFLRAVDDADALKDYDSMMAAKSWLAEVYRIWGRMEDSYNTNQETLEYYRSKKDHKTEALILRNLALIEQNRGEYEKAEKLNTESLEIAKKVGDLAGISAPLYNLAYIQHKRRNYDEAEKLYIKSLEIANKVGDQRGMAWASSQLGFLYEELGKYSIALQYYSKGATLFEKIGDKSHAAMAKEDVKKVQTELDKKKR
jgi:tetratricopeptide (TPR) repeat protein